MGDIIDLHDIDRKAEIERARVVGALEKLTAQLRDAPQENLRDALPIAASAVDKLARRIGPWLR